MAEHLARAGQTALYVELDDHGYDQTPGPTAAKSGEIKKRADGSCAQVLMQDGRELAEALPDLKAEYSWIIVVGAPLLARSDAHILAAQVDQFWVLVRWARTSRRAVEFALQALGLLNVRPDGLILTDADARAMPVSLPRTSRRDPRIGGSLVNRLRGLRL